MHKKPREISLNFETSQQVFKQPTVIPNAAPSSFSVFQWIKNKNKKNSHTSKTSQNSLEKERSRLGSRNYLWIVFFVKKFIEILKSFNLRQKMLRLNTYHFEAINDLAFCQSELNKAPTVNRPFHDLWERTKNKRKLLRKFVFIKNALIFIKKGTIHIIDRISIFNPEENLRMGWDFLVLFSLLSNVFYVPLIIGFEIDLEAYRFLNTRIVANLLFNFIPNIVFVMDMIVNMNTAYYSKGQYVNNRSKILKNYAKTHFTLDFLTIGPVALRWIADSNFSFREIDIFFFFRLFKLKKLISKMDEYLHLENKAQGLFNLGKLIFTILFVAHVFGCGWNYLGLLERRTNIPDNWHMRYELLDASWIEMYIYSIYWSITTMITVGYGDIIPYTIQERVFLCIVMINSCGVFAYSINRIGIIFQEMYEKDVKFRNKLVDITYFMTKRNISKALQSKVKRYMEYMHVEELYGYQRGTELIGTLSNKLQEEISVDLYVKLFQKMRIFNEHKFSEPFLKKISLKIQEISLAPDDLVFQENEEDEFRLYFILKGNIELFIKNTNSKLSTLKTGDYFGESSFFSCTKREISARSRHVSNLAYINLCDFLEICADFPEDYERFVYIKEQINVYNNYSIIKSKCASCDKINHPVTKCPLLCFAPNAEQVLPKYLQENNQKREIFSRNTSRLKTVSLKIKEKVNLACLLFQDNNQILSSPKNKMRRPGIYNLDTLFFSTFKQSKSNPVSLSELDISPSGESNYKQTLGKDSSVSPVSPNTDNSESFTKIVRNELRNMTTSGTHVHSNNIGEFMNNREIINKGIPNIRAELKKKSSSNNMTSSLRKYGGRSPIMKKLGLQKVRTREAIDQAQVLTNRSIANPLKINLSSRSSIDSMENSNYTPLDFDRVKNFTFFLPHNNIDYLLNHTLNRQNSLSKRKRNRGKVLLQFKKMVNTVKHSQKKTVAHNFSRKSDSPLNKLTSGIESPVSSKTPLFPGERQSLQMRSSVLRLEKVEMSDPKIPNFLKIIEEEKGNNISQIFEEIDHSDTEKDEHNEIMIFKDTKLKQDL